MKKSSEVGMRPSHVRMMPASIEGEHFEENAEVGDQGGHRRGRRGLWRKEERVGGSGAGRLI